MRRLDLTGQRFGRLIVVECAGTKRHRSGRGCTLWKCVCDCGNETVVAGNELKKGNTKSCGCYMKDRMRESHTKHGLTNSRLYSIWKSMKQRCYYPGSINYKNYGARGIVVCDEWKDDFLVFYDWAEENNYADGLTLDRIDTNGNYEPANCRWATAKEQSNNRRNNHLITFKGKTQTMKQWAEELNMSYPALRERLNDLNWDVEKALTTPIRKEIQK